MLSVKAALLSVIIPVYNVEPYLEQCLDSVVNQTYKDLEIICINDGSTDNSLKILEKYQKKDSRIKLINQKNKGLSGARNAGLDVAKGEYIAFVDSDDYLELNAYEEAMKVMLTDKNVDLVEFRTNTFADNNDTVLNNRANFANKRLFDTFSMNMHTGYVWNKIYKRLLLEKYKIKFIPKLLYEDAFFSYAYVLVSKHSVFINKQGYNYRKRYNSILDKDQKVLNKGKIDMFKNLDALIKYAKCYNLYIPQKELIFNEYINKVNLHPTEISTLLHTVNMWDKSILNSDCPNHLKLKYLKNRKLIEQKISNSKR